MTGERNTPTVVLDVSRTISGIGKGRPTGIDRVERAYLNHFLNSQKPVLFLARFNHGSALLDQQSMFKLYPRIENDGPWDKPGIFDKFMHLKNRNFAPVRGTLRRLALSSPFLGRSLKRHAPNGFIYVNVGHSKLLPKLWPKLRENGAAKIVAMVHDLIPIDFPQFTTPKSTEKFSKRMRALTQNADYLVYNSSDTERRMHNWFEKWGTEIDGSVVLLGTDPLPSLSVQPATSQPTPYFVCLGTIEPRKNHRLLLDIWAEFHKTFPADKIPHLHIVGRRGWLNEDVFDTLDNASFMGKTVFEHGQLSDEQLGSLLRGARGLLFPSFAEGFGYPLVESLQMGVPVICSELPCFREIAGDAPIYCNVKKQGEWSDKILETVTSNPCSNGAGENTLVFPNWDEHFHKIDTILDNIR